MNVDANFSRRSKLTSESLVAEHMKQLSRFVCICSAVSGITWMWEWCQAFPVVSLFTSITSPTNHGPSSRKPSGSTGWTWAWLQALGPHRLGGHLTGALFVCMVVELVAMVDECWWCVILYHYHTIPYHTILRLGHYDSTREPLTI